MYTHVDIDDMDVDSDMAVSINWGCFKRGFRAPFKTLVWTMSGQRGCSASARPNGLCIRSEAAHAAA